MATQETIHGMAAAWRRASGPEALFGPLDEPQLAQLRRRYRHLAQSVHPDRFPAGPERDAANEAFKLLQGWYARAQQRIAAGRYGSTVRFTVVSGRYHYDCDGDPIRGDLADLYPAYADALGGRVLLKIVRQPKNSDLMEREAQALQRIGTALEGDPMRAHFPGLIESFLLRAEDGSQRRVNVLADEPGTYSWQQVITAYPQGVHPADGAWMFNRLLESLAAAHGLGLVHGAVLPDHLLIRPSDHNGLLLDWCYSVPVGGTIRAISPGRRELYPPEVLACHPATPATDLFMAARSVAQLLGSPTGTVEGLPDLVPPPIAALLRAMLISAPARRAGDAWAVYEDFRAILERLYGPPSFRPFGWRTSDVRCQ